MKKRRKMTPEERAAWEARWERNHRALLERIARAEAELEEYRRRSA